MKKYPNRRRRGYDGKFLKSGMICETCGKQVAGKHWPQGWTQTGTSERSFTWKGSPMVASYCPEHRLK